MKQVRTLLGIPVTGGTPTEEQLVTVESALTQARAELARLERFATSPARKASLRWYLLGLPLGVLVAVTPDGSEPMSLGYTK